MKLFRDVRCVSVVEVFNLKKRSFGLVFILFLLLFLLSGCMSPWYPWPPRTQNPTNIEKMGGPLGARWVDVHVVGESTFALQDDGTLWGWGLNNFGQLGLGDGMITQWNEFIIRPVQILDDVATVFSQDSHLFVIRNDDSLWGWGPNNEGQLGIGSTDRQVKPVPILDHVATLYFSGSRTMAIRTDNSLWGWGNNQRLYFGDGESTRRLNPTWIMDDIATVTISDSNIMVMTLDNSLWAWGSNQNGQLGIGTTESQPTPIWIMDHVAYISSNRGNVMVITTNGQLWGWGRNDEGQLGIGTTAEQLSPAFIMDDIVAISRDTHTMAIQTDGSLWGWGWNRIGRFGIETITRHEYPRLDEDEQNEVRAGEQIARNQEIPRQFMENVDAVFVDSGLTLAITRAGELWGFGANVRGQLGLGRNVREDQTHPVFIMADVADILPDWRSIVLARDGNLWQLDQDGPTWLMDDVSKVFTSPPSAEQNATFALTTDGSLWFWGTNWIARQGDYPDAISVVIERGFTEGPLFMLFMILVILYLVGTVPIIVIAFIVMMVIAIVRRVESKKEEKNLRMHLLSTLQEARGESDIKKHEENEN